MNELFDSGKYPLIAKYTAPVKDPARDIVGREAEMRSIKAAMCRPELCNVLLLGDAGSGKALDDDTPIPVADSRMFVRMGDLKQGDVVYGRDGKPTRVLYVFPQGLKDAFDVHFSDGSAIRCCEEHLWDVMWRGDKAPRTMKLADIMDMQGSGRRKKLPFLPKQGEVDRDEAALPLDPYLYGLIASHGMPSEDTDLLLYSSKGIVEAAVQCCRGMSSEKDPDFHGYRLFHYGSPVRFHEFFGDKQLAYPVRWIPPEYKQGSAGQRRELLEGMFGIRKGASLAGRMFSTRHTQVASDVREILSSLGVRSSLLNVGTDACPDWCITTERAGYRLRMVRIEPVRRQVPMTCIMVDNTDHAFLAGKHYVPTHNTMLVQGTRKGDPGREYIEVNLSQMISEGGREMLPGNLVALFSEAEQYRAETGRDAVLFIDEFHRIIQESPAAVEALKPLLADSGTRGIRVIAATTFIEFQEYIAKNLPLVERLQRVNVNQPEKAVVIAILKGMAKTYGVDAQMPDDSVYEAIYDYTERYIPSNSQPRKSILMLDSMVGWHRAEKRRIDRQLLVDVLYNQEGINVSLKVDAGSIKSRLDAKVFAQELATTMIQNRLQICVADLHNKSRPMSSFLFAGSTGVGKGLTDDTMVPVYAEGGVRFKRNGDLEIGDYVFNRKGMPVLVTGVYHRGLKDVYKVTLTDGRSLTVDGSHLWTWRHSRWDSAAGFVTTDTEDLIRRGVTTCTRGGKKVPCIHIPMNGAVQWPDSDFTVEPYVVGALIGGGVLTVHHLCMTSGDGHVARKVAGLIGAKDCKCQKGNSNVVFKEDDLPGGRWKLVQLADVLGGDMFGCLIGTKSSARRIPEAYKHGSIRQRSELLQGLFDTNGYAEHKGGGKYKLKLSTASAGLAEDVREVLFSLGFRSTVTSHKNGSGSFEYRVSVKCRCEDMYGFFTHPGKLSRLEGTEGCPAPYHMDTVLIESIEKLPEQQHTTCIMVEDGEHLYQAGQYVVSHNTEVCKQLAAILFNDPTRLVRMDMSEYANPDSMERFRAELTMRVWAKPFCIVLLDEIEKACGEVTRLLLQVLDDGRLIDANNREVVFKNCYIVLTTNAGSEVFHDVGAYSASDTGDGEGVRRYEKLIRDSIKVTSDNGKFPPELLGRVNAIIPFQPLSFETKRSIATAKLKSLEESVMSVHGIELRIDKRVVDYVVEDKAEFDTDAGGARNVVAVIENDVTAKVAEFINRHPEIRKIGVRVAGKMKGDDKSRLVSTAYIKVVAIKDKKSQR